MFRAMILQTEVGLAFPVWENPWPHKMGTSPVKLSYLYLFLQIRDQGRNVPGWNLLPDAHPPLLRVSPCLRGDD
jgi:hypothetical protein